MSVLAVDDFFSTSNYIEAGLWIAVALVFAAFAIKRAGPTRRRCVIAAAVFALFGVSDIVEVQTGAWWRPWWLFVWKATCAAAMLWLLLGYLLSRKKV